MRRSVGMLAAIVSMLVMTATARGTRHEAPGTAPGTEHPPSRSALRWASQAPGTTARRAITDLDLLDFVWLADPQLSPDGRSVAVVRVTVDREHDTYASAIWEFSTDGSFQPRALTAGPRDTSPRWSPNGTMLAFIRATEDRGGQADPPQVFALDRSGGDSRPLTRQPEGVSGFAWSPDSATLAVVSSVLPAPVARGSRTREAERRASHHTRDVSRGWRRVP